MCSILPLLAAARHGISPQLPASCFVGLQGIVLDFGSPFKNGSFTIREKCYLIEKQDKLIYFNIKSCEIGVINNFKLNLLNYFRDTNGEQVY